MIVLAGIDVHGWLKKKKKKEYGMVVSQPQVCVRPRLHYAMQPRHT